MITSLPGDDRYVIMNRFSIFNDFYRAQVTEVDIDDNDYGAVRVFIPDLMIEGIEPNFGNENYGIIAYPGNNTLGGYNGDEEEDCSFQASVDVPLLGSWVWIRFESGNTGRCFYTNAFQYKQAKVPPENRDVDEPHKVHTYKLGSGRSFIISDSEDQARVEITGKRRKLTSPKRQPPEGEDHSERPPDNEVGSVYDIDDNMTTILLDERENKQKLLIRTYKGDFIHIDIDQRELQAYFKNDISIKTDGKLSIEAEEIHIESKKNTHITSQSDFHVVSKSSYLNQDRSCYILSNTKNRIHGDKGTILQKGSRSARPARTKQPRGERST